MLFKPRSKHKRFDYTPRFYDPSKDDNIRRRIRIKSKTRRRDPSGMLYAVILLALAIWIYTRF